MTTRVVRAAYREVLRNAKLMDKYASIKAVMSPMEVSHNPACQRAVLHLLRQKIYYLPDASAVDVVRQMFRLPKGDIGDAFVALRYLGEKLHVARQYGLLTETQKPPTRQYGLLESPPSLSSVSITTRIRTGVFLIAHPLLRHPFEKTVVLITNHDKQGTTTGFIINEKGDKKHTLWPNYNLDADVQPLFGSHAVNFGGPVDPNSIHFLHTQPTLGGTAVGRNDPTRLFVGGDIRDFTKVPHPRPHEVVFFRGYAGWTNTMLQKELDIGSWIMVTAPLSLALRPPADIWRHLLVALGPEYEQFATIPRNVDFLLKDA